MKCARLRLDRFRAVHLGQRWRRAMSIFVSTLCCAVGGFAAGPQKAHSESGQLKIIKYRNIAPGVSYVGSKTCAPCHSDVYDNYMKTDMGRSMSLPGDPAQLKKVPGPIKIYDKRSDRYFEVFRRDSDLYQGEYELGPDGKEVFRDTRKIEYVVGSGANGLSYIVRRDNYLFEAPLSYYSRAKAWGLSPGYELGDYGFSRLIAAECMMCHSGRPQPVPNRSGLYKDLPFRELAIGCENCHGPGELHVQERLRGAPLSGQTDLTIVNPSNLPGWLADNICMNCHQGGDTRVLQPGKDYIDFRPGTPLVETVAILAVPYSRESPPQDPLLQHYALMTLSRCFRESRGRLQCITCHDPHQQPSPPEAPNYYRGKCLSCHTEKACTVPLKVRLDKSPPDNCVGCHMPKQQLKFIGHSALTDHRIIAYEEEPFPEAAFHLTTPNLPDFILFNSIPGESKMAISPLVLVRAFGELKDSRPTYVARYRALLDRVAKTEPENVLVLSALARRKLEEGTPQALRAAIQDLSRALDLGSTAPSDFELLAELVARSGNESRAIAILKRGITVAPFSSRLYKALALGYIKARQYPDAQEVMRKELELFPEDSFIRMLLKKAEAGTPSP